MEEFEDLDDFGIDEIDFKKSILEMKKREILRENQNLVDELNQIHQDMYLRFSDKEICLYVRGFLNGLYINTQVRDILYEDFKKNSNIKMKYIFEEVV